MTPDMQLQIGNIANALQVLRKRVGGHRLSEAEVVAKLAEIEAMVAPVEGSPWSADTGRDSVKCKIHKLPVVDLPLMRLHEGRR